MSSPVRTCIGCRRRVNRSELLRLVVVNNSVIADIQVRLPGRGAWLHPTKACAELAVRRRAFGRAFKTDNRLDLSQVLDIAGQAVADV